MGIRPGGEWEGEIREVIEKMVAAEILARKPNVPRTKEKSMPNEKPQGPPTPTNEHGPAGVVERETGLKFHRDAK